MQQIKEYYDRATQYMNSGQYGLAIRTISHVIDSDVNEYDAYLLRSRLYGFQNKHQLAMTDIETAIKLAPNVGEAYIRRAGIKKHLKDIEGAIEDYTRGINLGAREFAAYFGRAGAYNRIANDALAIEDFSKSIELAPDLQVLYFVRAKCYLNLGKITEFLQGCAEGILRDIDHASFISTGFNSKTLITYLAKFAVDNPLTSEFLLVRSYAHYDNGDTGYALSDLEKIINDSNADARLYIFKAILCNALGRLIDAYDALMQVPEALHARDDYKNIKQAIEAQLPKNISM